jgi:hypothetical protein
MLFGTIYERLSLDGGDMALHPGVFIHVDEELWTYLEYKILMSSDATIFSVIAVVMGAVLVFWIRRSA